VKTFVWPTIPIGQALGEMMLAVVIYAVPR